MNRKYLKKCIDKFTTNLFQITIQIARQSDLGNVTPQWHIRQIIEVSGFVLTLTLF